MIHKIPGGYGVAAILIAVGLLGLPRLISPLRVNLANLYFAGALTTLDDAEKLSNSNRAVVIFAQYADSVIMQQRLAKSNELKWQAASSLGKTTEALQAYTAGHDGSVQSDPTDMCESTLGRLEAETFSGLAPGTNRVERKIDNRHVAYLFSSLPISRVVCFPEAGRYSIGVTAQEREPSPIEIAVRLDDWIASTATFALGDNEWSQQWISMIVPKGQHILSLALDNDYFDQSTGLDRNAAVDYVEIKSAEVNSTATEIEHDHDDFTD